MAITSRPTDRYFKGLQERGVGLPGLAGEAVVNLCAPRVYPSIKRCLDFAIALALLAILAPVLLVVAIVVRLDDSSGPVLFRQTRVGQYGRPFEMLKFRTMRAERRRTGGGPPAGIEERRRRHKSTHDPRVTRCGRFLRRTCLDELPQLWNVLRGEMSLVGPRPELPVIVERYEPWQHLRHVVAPGITGWWQVKRSADQLMHETTELDLYYVQHYSVSLDLRILALTLGAIIDGRGAY
jgi:lipopolysaccharide/colanic/teichoic acid biosynthesis glycosyltransferase